MGFEANCVVEPSPDIDTAVRDPYTNLAYESCLSCIRLTLDMYEFVPTNGSLSSLTDKPSRRDSIVLIAMMGEYESSLAVCPALSRNWPVR